MRIAFAAALLLSATLLAAWADASAVDLSALSTLEHFAAHRFEYRFVLKHGERLLVGLRDPVGQYHLVGPGDYIGPNDGRIVEIREDLILIAEIGRDPDGSFFELETRIPFLEDRTRWPDDDLGDGDGDGDEPEDWDLYNDPARQPVQPLQERRRENLEQFHLRSLVMRGTTTRGDDRYALIEDPLGVLHYVQPGNFLGRDHGRIIAIDDARLELREVVPDNFGSWTDREDALGVVRGSRTWYQRTVARLFTAAAGEGDVEAMRRLTDLYGAGSALVLDRAQLLGSALAAWEIYRRGPPPRPPEPSFSELSEHELARADRLADHLLHGPAARDGLPLELFASRALPFGARQLVEPANAERYRALAGRRLQVGERERQVARAREGLAARWSALGACGAASGARPPAPPPGGEMRWRGPIEVVQRAADARMDELQRAEDRDAAFAASLEELERDCARAGSG